MLHRGGGFKIQGEKKKYIYLKFVGILFALFIILWIIKSR